MVPVDYETASPPFPDNARPAYPFGLSKWASRTFVTALLGGVSAFVFSGATLLKLAGYGEAADAVTGAINQVDQESLTTAILTIVQLGAGAFSGVTGLIAAQGRLNGGRALSPLT